MGQVAGAVYKPAGIERFRFPRDRGKQVKSKLSGDTECEMWCDLCDCYCFYDF